MSDARSTRYGKAIEDDHVQIGRLRTIRGGPSIDRKGSQK
jgi:hypothetical protein